MKNLTEYLNEQLMMESTRGFKGVPYKFVYEFTDEDRNFFEQELGKEYTYLMNTVDGVGPEFMGIGPGKFVVVSFGPGGGGTIRHETDKALTAKSIKDFNYPESGMDDSGCPVKFISVNYDGLDPNGLVRHIGREYSLAVQATKKIAQWGIKWLAERNLGK